MSHFIAEVVFSISKCRLHSRNFLTSEEGLAETRLRCFDTQALVALELELFNLDSSINQSRPSQVCDPVARSRGGRPSRSHTW